MKFKVLKQKKARLRDALCSAIADLDLAEEVETLQEESEGTFAFQDWLDLKIKELTQVAFTEPVPKPVTGNSVWMSEHINRLQSPLLDLQTVSRAAEARIESSLKVAEACLLQLLGRSVSQSLCFVHIALYAFTNKDQYVIHMLLNKQIAARAKGVWLSFLQVPALRRSQIVCSTRFSTTLFQCPPQNEILHQWFKTRAINQLVGFENNWTSGKGDDLNFILSNGTRSTQRTEHQRYYDHMIPKDALNKIRSVTIHYHHKIECFSFFDKDGALLWKIGDFYSWQKVETVKFSENEVIVGVVAKLHPNYKAVYTDFQFLIASRID